MEIVIERGKITTLEDLPPHSIALDGFVMGPQIDTEHHRYSFDHHGGCVRFATSSACMQAMTAVMLGLDPEPYTVYCNDVDVDVAAAIWCLRNPERCKEPNIARLIDAIGKGDMHAGAYDVNGTRKLIEWICAPQVESIRNGDYEKLSNAGLKPILESILHRIDIYGAGEHAIEVSREAPKAEFKVLRNENGWALFESQDPHVLAYIWQAGFDRAVVTRPLEDGSLAVTLAKRSDFIDSFCLERLYRRLNRFEKGWGGSSNIGGAPRRPDGSRSQLRADKLIELVDDEVLGNPIAAPKKTATKKTTRSKGPS